MYILLYVPTLPRRSLDNLARTRSSVSEGREKRGEKDRDHEALPSLQYLDVVLASRFLSGHRPLQFSCDIYFKHVLKLKTATLGKKVAYLLQGTPMI